MSNNIRLQKILRDALGVSRRKAEELISAKLVVVNGVLATLGQSADPATDSIKVEGKALAKPQALSYIMLNKPAGYVTTREDPHAEKTVYALLPKEFSTLFPVGRLDKETEGLLLLTNDGDLCYRLTHPKFEVEKEYYVTIMGNLYKDEQARLAAGLVTKEVTYYPAKIKIVKNNPSQTDLYITIHEGKKREVRNMFGFLKHRVIYLKRVRVQDLELGSLRIGEWRELTKAEVSKLSS